MNNKLKENIKAAYFIGIGGIGMSAIARYFNNIGVLTCGYDKTPSNITESLINEGIEIHFEDDVNLIDEKVKRLPKDEIIVVYTPAVPNSHSEFQWFKLNSYKIYKRAEVLGLITNPFKTVAVAGTHGKTSVSTIIAHIFKYSNLNLNAFLGGISKNYNSNLILSSTPNKAIHAVTEADEFDRSFLQLYPFSAVVSSIDEDHLDIYEDLNDLRRTFSKFVNQINKEGFLVIKKGVEINSLNCPKKTFTYSLNDAKSDFYAKNIVNNANKSTFDIITPYGIIENVEISIPGNLNVENVVAAASIAILYKINIAQIKYALKTWKGVKRRFEYVVNNEEVIYIDDYAHHPEELKSFLTSIKNIYKNKHITGVFQPHLYTRTRDFADEFAKSLDLLDTLYLLDIYPAREEPIENVSSKLIFNKLKLENKEIVGKEEVLQRIKTNKVEVLVTVGAGDIDRLVKPIEEILLSE